MEHRRGYARIGGEGEGEGEDQGDGAGASAVSVALTTRWTRVRLLAVLVIVAAAAGLAALSTMYWSDKLDAPVMRTAPFRMLAQPERVSDGGSLIVSWTGDPAPFKLGLRDYVTLSCGPTSGDDDYLVRKNVIEEGGSLQRFVIFQGLVMMRCNYTAKYFSHRSSGGGGKHVLAGTLEVGMNESFASPKHGHLSLTTGEADMAIMFNSASARAPKVRYGISTEELTLEATGTSATYSASDMCQPPASILAQHFYRDPGYMHTVIMRNLDPDREYYYQFGNEHDGWSKIERFRSRPKASTKSANVIAFGDLGVYPAPASETTVKRMYEDVTSNGFDSFLLHFGDISYAFGDGSVWDRFFHLIEPVATKIPYMVSVGNHEYCYTAGGERDPSGGVQPSGGSFSPSWGNFGNDSNGECGVPMHYRWHAPATGNWIYWYSFNYGGIHVVQMSTEHDFTRGSEQFEWLARDLANVDRSVTPWVILTAHRMMYSTQLGNEGEMVVGDHLRANVEDLLYEHRVNLVLVGHQHSYERTCAIYQGNCALNGEAPVHMVVGTAGFPLNTGKFSTKYGNWSLKHVNEYGYLRIRSTPDSMQLQFVLNKEGQVFDDFNLTPWH